MALLTFFERYFGFMKNRNELKKAIKIFMLGYGLILLEAYPIRLVINHTNSLPQRLFVHFLTIQPELGDYALFFNAWYGSNLIKQIIGREGDILSYDRQGFLCLNGTPLTKPLTQAKDGRKLTPIEAQIIPPGYVFVYNPQKRSFDSRYQEVGLLPIPSLHGRVIPVL